MGRQRKVELDALSNEEEEAINAGIAADPDTWELTDEDFARMKPVRAFPDLVTILRKAGKLPEAAPDRVAVTLHLDPDLLAKLRKAEDGWEDYANAMLRKGFEG